MLKVLLQKLFTVLLAAVILITTSGFTVFEHHCRTDETTEFSLLVPDFDCNHKEHHHDDLASCCSADLFPDNVSCDAGNCCDIDSYVVKLDIKLDSQSFSKKITDHTPVIPLHKIISTEVSTTELSHIRVSNNLSPPLSGRSLLIFLQQLNIPDLSV